MRSRLLFVEEIQGEMIRKAARARGPVTLRVYRLGHEAVCEKQAHVVHELKVPLLMGVNHGRWVAICPECVGGISTGRGWNEARCFDCGAVFRTVVWPKEMEDIERALLLRLDANRNWLPGETVDMLLGENIEHRVTEVR